MYWARTAGWWPSTPRARARRGRGSGAWRPRSPTPRRWWRRTAAVLLGRGRPLLAVDARRGEVIGETRSRGGAAGQGFLDLMPAPVVADGKVFATAPDGTLFAVDGRNPAGW
ncbi:PQQ-binding-like beta-propeller repeat protein [Streptomyces indonesiensis]